MGKPFQKLYFMGHDNPSGRYTMVSLGSRYTTTLFAEGLAHNGGSEIEFKGSMRDPKDRDLMFRHVYHLNEDGSHVLQETLESGSRNRATMRITFVPRKKR